MQQSSHRWDNLPTQIDEEPSNTKPKKETSRSVTRSENSLRECPKRWWGVSESIFVRGRIGVGLGGSFSLSYQFTSPNKPFLENLEAQVSVGWVGTGASIEAGGGGTLSAAMKLHDAPCP